MDLDKYIVRALLCVALLVLSPFIMVGWLCTRAIELGSTWRDRCNWATNPPACGHCGGTPCHCATLHLHD